MPDAHCNIRCFLPKGRAGRPRQVLAEALAAVRRPNGSPGGPAEPAQPFSIFSSSRRMWLLLDRRNWGKIFGRAVHGRHFLASSRASQANCMMARGRETLSPF